MNILSENSILNERTISTARRVVSIAVGATVGISMGLTSVQASQPGRALMVGYHSIGRLELASSTPVVIPATSTELLPEQALGQAPRLVYGLAPVRTARTRTAKWHQVGLASWYGQQFQGRQTANGELFDMNELSCAHRTLPLGTWVKVTNLHNHKWVVLRVNDRGPVPETRIVDLSSQAAHLLGMRTKGISRVRLDVIDPKQAAEAARMERLHALRTAQDQAAAAQSAPLTVAAASTTPQR